MAKRTRSELAGTVGRIAILYRPAADPEPRQQAIYDALGISACPGNTEKTII